jgi:hypothetical protein
MSFGFVGTIAEPNLKNLNKTEWFLKSGTQTRIKPFRTGTVATLNREFICECANCKRNIVIREVNCKALDNLYSML